MSINIDVLNGWWLNCVLVLSSIPDFLVVHLELLLVLLNAQFDAVNKHFRVNDFFSCQRILCLISLKATWSSNSNRLRFLLNFWQFSRYHNWSACRNKSCRLKIQSRLKFIDFESELALLRALLLHTLRLLLIKDLDSGYEGLKIGDIKWFGGHLWLLLGRGLRRISCSWYELHNLSWWWECCRVLARNCRCGSGLEGRGSMRCLLHGLALFDSLDLLDGGVVGLWDVVDELAALTVGTVSIGTVLLAQLCLVKYRHVSLYHHVGLSMGERAL